MIKLNKRIERKVLLLVRTLGADLAEVGYFLLKQALVNARKGAQKK